MANKCITGIFVYAVADTAPFDFIGSDILLSFLLPFLFF